MLLSVKGGLHQQTLLISAEARLHMNGADLISLWLLQLVTKYFYFTLLMLLLPLYNSATT